MRFWFLDHFRYQKRLKDVLGGVDDKDKREYGGGEVGCRIIGHESLVSLEGFRISLIQ